MPDQSYRDLARTGRRLVFDKALFLLFLRDGKSDPSRKNRSVEGSLRVGNETQSNASGGGARAWSSRISAETAMLHISRGTYDGPPIREGDKVRDNVGTEDQPSYVFFEVRGVNDRDPQDIIVTLSEA